MRVLKLFVFLIGSMLIAACTPQEPEVSRTQVQYPFTVRTVDVKIAQNAPEGRFAKDAVLRENARTVLENTLEQRFRIVPGGPTKARAVVTLTTMRLRDAGSRSFGGTNAIFADIQIVNSKGTLLARNPRLGYLDQAKNNTSTVNGIPIGLLINLAKNSSDQEVGTDLQTTVSGFSDAAVQWLAKGRGVAPKQTSVKKAANQTNEGSASESVKTVKTPKEKRVWKGTCFKVWDPVINNYVCED